MVSKDWPAGERVTQVTARGRNDNFESAGKLGTLYGDWHITPRNVPTFVRGDCS